ncbi:nuclear transport factor 2 family protein [Dyella agri]|uniref:Nuclear transport factor 2 family protein n=1 Tax=Dyella agri TaxID=1926869 RepID=A0ABW8KLR9_9GAMM
MPYLTYRHVRTSLACVGLWLAVGVIGTPAMAAPQDGTSAMDETAHTAAAVKAVDQHWLEAEESGDAAWLDGMLLPGYRSVGVAGTFATKAAIVAHAAKNRGADKMKQEVAAWQAAHPVEQQVTLQGDTAILSFVSSAPATKGKLYSSDVFVYVDGRWHALYSAHTELGK